MMLLALFLFFDSFTSQWQSRMFTKHRVRCLKCKRVSYVLSVCNHHVTA
ncbi:unnamed protein product [Choristocarpus tenellus]